MTTRKPYKTVMRPRWCPIPPNFASQVLLDLCERARAVDHDIMRDLDGSLDYVVVSRGSQQREVSRAKTMAGLRTLIEEVEE